MLSPAGRPTIAYIDLDILAANFSASRKFIGEDLAYMAVVKADAYGHGAVNCARRLEAEGVDWFGVALPEEGIELRKAGITKPILCLGSCWAGQEQMLIDYSLTPVAYDRRGAQSLARAAAEAGLTLPVHVKIDTGMGRLGIDHSKAHEFATFVRSLKKIKITGLLTHFASADDPGEDSFTRLQIERFETACSAFRAVGHHPEWLDLANSPGAICHPRGRGNLVRLGGALYGLLDDILPSETPGPELKPVMELRSRIAHIRTVKAGTTLGYGRTFMAGRDSLVALVPIGYADGYRRGLSNRSIVGVNGTLVPVIGRISMDWIMADVTEAPYSAPGDEVVLIGSNGTNTIRASDLAREIDTIGYEITCGISDRVPRIYLGPTPSEVYKDQS